MTDAWVRPYAPGRGRWLVLGWELFGLALVDWTTVRLFDLDARTTAVLTAALAVLWAAGAVRILRMGLYVSGSGVRIRGLFASRTLRWTEIDEFVFDEARRLGLTVLIRHRDGRYVNTSLWAQGIDFHARPRAFREVYGLLRERHSAALGRVAG